MAAFLDLFSPIQKGNFGLTEESIYKSIKDGGPFIPLWGGNSEHASVDRKVSIHGKTKSGACITIFKGDGIIISLDGSSGCMTLKEGEEFTLNHHAGFFQVKESDEIIPEFFVIFYQNQLQGESLSEGSKTLTLGQIYSMNFEIPSQSAQLEIMKVIRPLIKKRSKILEIRGKLENIKNRQLSHDYKKFQIRNISINQVLDYLSGNTGLTEQLIYQKSQIGINEYRVLSGALLEENQFGKISNCTIDGKDLRKFVNKPGILVIRKGKAGVTKYLMEGKYALTDDAYILFIKESCPYKIDLRWLNLHCKNLFLDYSSSSDNGTWNMTGFFENVKIDIPDFKEQMLIIENYSKIEEFEHKLGNMLLNIQHLLSKKIL